jgi:hypothetical protein
LTRIVRDLDIVMENFLSNWIEVLRQIHRFPRRSARVQGVMQDMLHGRQV